MEDNKKKGNDIDIYLLFTNPQKIYKTNFIAKIEDINSETEQISMTITNLNNKRNCYKGLYINKGEIYPIPKLNDIVKINEIQFKLDQNFNPGFFIKITKYPDINIIDIPKGDILDFTKEHIIKTVMNKLKLTKILYSNIFQIVDDSWKENYILICPKNNQKYILSKKIDYLEYSFNKNEIIYISNYYEDNNNTIIPNLITYIEKLTDEKLLLLLEKNRNIYKEYFIGKIVEIQITFKSNKRITLLDDNKNIFEIIKKDEEHNIKLGQIILVTNYKILNTTTNKFPVINVNDKSFFYLTSQNIYFSNKIKLNSFSIIQFHFLDFKKDNKANKTDNLYSSIKIEEEKKNIISDEMNIIVETKKMKNYEYYPISIQLISNEKSNDTKNITFNFNLLHGLLNKINAFINFKTEFPYFYEYIYYYFDSVINQTYKIIKINNNTSKSVFIFDNFESSNRIRFNLLNIPFQNECEKLLNNTNSLMVCEIINGKSFCPKKIGIFSIDEIKKSIPELKSNNIFDIYYNDFGLIYNYLSNSENNKNDINFLITLKEKYNKMINLNENLDFKNISSYEEEISLSQLKTRLGIIVAYYLNICDESKIMDYMIKIKYIFSRIYFYKNSLSCFQFLRLFIFLTKNLLYKNNDYTIYLISKLEKFSPYLMAYKYNIEEIQKTTESSRLFMGYLQLDSYILTNHLIKEEKSYSLSIEPLFMIKNHLL